MYRMSNIISLVVTCAIGGFAIHMYGKAKYNEGKSDRSVRELSQRHHKLIDDYNRLSAMYLDLVNERNILVLYKEMKDLE